MDGDGVDEIYSSSRFGPPLSQGSALVHQWQSVTIAGNSMAGNITLPLGISGDLLGFVSSTESHHLLAIVVDKSQQQHLEKTTSVNIKYASGLVGSSTPPSPNQPLRTTARKLVLCRTEGPALSGNFVCPDLASGGSSLMSAKFRLTHTDYHAIGQLKLKRIGSKEDLVLRLGTSGGGSAYRHTLDYAVYKSSTTGEGERLTIDKEHFPILPGVWYSIELLKSIEGVKLQITGNGLPNDTNQVGFSRTVDIGWIEGDQIDWEWVSQAPNNGVESRDRTALLALDWIGPGQLPDSGFATSPSGVQITKVVEQLKQAKASGHQKLIESCIGQLEQIAGPARVSTKPGVERNGLAQYYLNEYAWFSGKRMDH